mmetsp:Transcript_56550/g.164025  ORF Transcript_56550/g.164025 Transcript_56550/m.164025 type:complete len:444 (+) Transcript_56550:317-1648(+)
MLEPPRRQHLRGRPQGLGGPAQQPPGGESRAGLGGVARTQAACLAAAAVASHDGARIVVEAGVADDDAATAPPTGLHCARPHAPRRAVDADACDLDGGGRQCRPRARDSKSDLAGGRRWACRWPSLESHRGKRRRYVGDEVVGDLQDPQRSRLPEEHVCHPGLSADATRCADASASICTAICELEAAQAPVCFPDAHIAGVAHRRHRAQHRPHEPLRLAIPHAQRRRFRGRHRSRPPRGIRLRGRFADDECPVGTDHAGPVGFATGTQMGGSCRIADGPDCDVGLGPKGLDLAVALDLASQGYARRRRKRHSCCIAEQHDVLTVWQQHRHHCACNGIPGARWCRRLQCPVHGGCAGSTSNARTTRDGRGLAAVAAPVAHDVAATLGPGAGRRHAAANAHRHCSRHNQGDDSGATRFCRDLHGLLRADVAQLDVDEGALHTAGV